jgi:hypothetical protein
MGLPVQTIQSIAGEASPFVVCNGKATPAQPMQYSRKSLSLMVIRNSHALSAFSGTTALARVVSACPALGARSTSTVSESLLRVRYQGLWGDAYQRVVTSCSDTVHARSPSETRTTGLHAFPGPEEERSVSWNSNRTAADHSFGGRTSEDVASWLEEPRIPELQAAVAATHRSATAWTSASKYDRQRPALENICTARPPETRMVTESAESLRPTTRSRVAARRRIFRSFILRSDDERGRCADARAFAATVHRPQLPYVHPPASRCPVKLRGHSLLRA